MRSFVTNFIKKYNEQKYIYEIFIYFFLFEFTIATRIGKMVIPKAGLYGSLPSFLSTMRPFLIVGTNRKLCLPVDPVVSSQDPGLG